MGKESAFNAGDSGDMGSISGSGRSSKRSAWQCNLIFLSGESHGREPGGLQSIGIQRVRHDWNDWACTQYNIREKFILPTVY